MSWTNSSRSRGTPPSRPSYSIGPTSSTRSPSQCGASSARASARCPPTRSSAASSCAARAIAYGHVMHATLRALADCRHPLVAQIHGVCVGGGLEIAALCDLRICGESSRFGAPIKSLGLTMAYAEMAPLARLVGTAVALEILLEGRVFDAAEAKEKRLVTRIVPDGEVAAEARATAARIAEGAPLVARWHKRFARRLVDPRPLAEGEYEECFACFDTEDFRIGYAAFLAKQRPVFVGR